jgi:hypothetical protein
MRVISNLLVRDTVTKVGSGEILGRDENWKNNMLKILMPLKSYNIRNEWLIEGSELKITNYI